MSMYLAFCAGNGVGEVAGIDDEEGGDGCYAGYGAGAMVEGTVNVAGIEGEEE